MIMVIRPGWKMLNTVCSSPKATTSAAAKMMSGVTIGRYSTVSMAPRARCPQRKRSTPNARAVPSTVEMSVETSASTSVLRVYSSTSAL